MPSRELRSSGEDGPGERLQRRPDEAGGGWELPCQGDAMPGPRGSKDRREDTKKTGAGGSGDQGHKQGLGGPEGHRKESTSTSEHSGSPCRAFRSGRKCPGFQAQPEWLLCGGALQGTERKQKAQAGAVAAVQGEPTVAKLQHSPDRRSGAQLETGVGAGSTEILTHRMWERKRRSCLPSVKWGQSQ